LFITFLTDAIETCTHRGRLTMFKTSAGFGRPPGQEKWILKTAADYPSAWNIADAGKT
jgi:hypothetical protein